MLLRNKGKSINEIKKKLESRHKILKMAVANWAAEMIIKEALRRERIYSGPRSNKMKNRSPCEIQNNVSPNDHHCYECPEQSASNHVEENKLEFDDDNVVNKEAVQSNHEEELPN